MQSQNKIYKLYDYKINGNILPNSFNPEFIQLLISDDYQLDQNFLENFQKTYNDGFSVWNLDGVLTDNMLLDESVPTYKLSKKHADIEIVNDNEFYFYVVSPFGGASSTFGYPSSYNSGRPFFYFIPESSKKLIQEHKNTYLIINYGNEGTLDFHWFDIIHYNAELFNIPIDKIVFVISDFNIKENYENYCIERGYADRMKVFPIMWSLSSKSNEYYQLYNEQKTSFGSFSNDCSVCKKEDIDLDKERDKHFLMFNRRLRPHRYYSILMFNKLNILDKFNISYDFETCMNYVFDKENYKHHGDDKQFRDELLKENEKVLNGELKKSIIDYDDLPNVWGFNFEQKESYLNSYIHIISETNFYESGLYLSEKTWKPMGQLQPFIMMGPAGSLELIRSYGFKTFDGFIDESYDKIENNEERFKFLINEIERLSNLPKEELKNWYKSIFNDILVHNQKVLIDYKDTDKKHIRKQFLDLFE